MIMITLLSRYIQSMVRTSFKNQSSKLSTLLMAQLLRRGRKPASKQANGGFTLVELLVVVVILGILGAVGVPAYFAQVRTAKVNSANAAALAAAKACSAYWVSGNASATALVLGSGVTPSAPCLASTAGTQLTFGVDTVAPSKFAGISGPTVTLAADGSVVLTTPAS
jgi:prepilin-type N-terminal cleavage/methylation domain-containing protein